MTEKIKIREVLVVEGKNDTANSRYLYDADTYEIRGSAVNDDSLERIKRLNDLRGVIAFTNPDYGRERIRKIIMDAVPNVRHTFLNRDEVTPRLKSKGRSLGVEYASFEDLQKTLSSVSGNFDDDNQFDIIRVDLMRMGLLMGNDSRRCREHLGGKLRTGYSNGKQLLKHLELFSITLAEAEETMERYKE